MTLDDVCRIFNSFYPLVTIRCIVDASPLWLYYVSVPYFFQTWFFNWL